MKKRKLGGFALCSMLLTLCLPRPSAAAAENSADRSFLSGVLPYGYLLLPQPALMHSVGVCATSATSREKTLSLNGELTKAN
jgi:hypothetical protein